VSLIKPKCVRLRRVLQETVPLVLTFPGLALCTWLFLTIQTSKYKLIKYKKLILLQWHSRLMFFTISSLAWKINMKKHYSSHYTWQSLNLHVLSWYHNWAKVDNSENWTAAGHSEVMTTISHFRSTANWPITHGSLLEFQCVHIPDFVQPFSLEALSGFTLQINLVQNIIKGYTYLANSGNTIILCWISSHVNIRCTEKADTTAKSAPSLFITKYETSSTWTYTSHLWVLLRR